MRFHIVLCLLEATAASAIVCYDSQRAQPDRVTTCAADQVCYAEYYAVKVGPAGKLFHRHAMPDAPTRLLQYYDRFCIHPQHCENRGLVDGQCLQLEDLDPLVRRTFRSKLKQQQLEPAQLVHTRFCCCSSEKCNGIGAKEVLELFNVTSSAASKVFIAGMPYPHYLTQYSAVATRILQAISIHLLPLCISLFVFSSGVMV